MSWSDRALMSWSDRAPKGWSDPIRAGALAGLLALAACGFEPLYDPAGPAAAVAGRVDVAVIPGTTGYLMRERLVERLGAGGTPTHRLAIDLKLSQVGVALTEDDVTSRFDVVGVAEWKLVPIAGTVPVMAEEARAVSGYSAPTSATTSAFAILSARRDAEERLALVLADRIAQRIAVEAGAWSAPGGTALLPPGGIGAPIPQDDGPDLLP